MKIQPEQCAEDKAFVSAVKVGGISEIRISRLEDESDYVVSVKIKRSGNTFFLATRRNPHEPRRFKRVDVAIAATHKLLGATKFIVTID